VQKVLRNTGDVPLVVEVGRPQVSVRSFYQLSTGHLSPYFFPIFDLFGLP
jgi:hypothetical protein